MTEFQVEVTQTDFLAAQGLFVRKVYLPRYLRRAFLIYAVMAVTAFFLRGSLPDVKLFFIVLPLLFLALIPLKVRLLMLRSLRNAQKDGEFGRVLHVTVDEENIVLRSDGRQAVLPLVSIVRVVSDDDRLLLFVNRSSFIAFKKSDFPDRDSFVAFLENLRSVLSHTEK